jgi:hypothetical protein
MKNGSRHGKTMTFPGTSTLMLNRFRLADVFYVQDLENLYMLIIVLLYKLHFYVLVNL